MHHSRHAMRLLAAATLSLAALSLAACGGDDDDDTASQPTTVATTAPTTAGAVGQAASPITTNAPTTVTTAASGGGAYDYYDDSSGSTPAAATGALKTGSTSKGTVLTDDKGLTLYTWDTDTAAGKSACNASCASAWPPVVVAASATAPTVTGALGAFTIIARDDGAKQVAYKGKPLYRFAGDSKAGDIAGDGVGGTWHIAQP